MAAQSQGQGFEGHVRNQVDGRRGSRSRQRSARRTPWTSATTLGSAGLREGRAAVRSATIASFRFPGRESELGCTSQAAHRGTNQRPLRTPLQRKNTTDPSNSPVDFINLDHSAGNELQGKNMTRTIFDLTMEYPSTRLMDPETKKLYFESRSQEDEIFLLRKQIADASLKELRLLSEKHILERKLADLRMAVDERQEEAISDAMKQLSQRKNHIEENMRLANELKVEEEELYVFTSSLLSVLAEYNVCPPQINASTISTSTKHLYQQMHGKIRSLNDSLGEMTQPGNIYNPNHQQPTPLRNEPASLSYDMDANRSARHQYAQDSSDRHAEQMYQGSRFQQSLPFRDRNMVGTTMSNYFEDNAGTGELQLYRQDNQEYPADDDPLPGIEGFQIVGEPSLGSTLRACGFPTNGTTLCNFQWVRYHEDGTRQSIEGATMYEYVVTADDVGTLLAVECTPMDDSGHQGDLVREFANNEKKITCDPEMQDDVDSYILNGRADFDVFVLQEYSSEWELATLVLKRPCYQIKIKHTGVVLIDEKYSKKLQTKIPNGRTTQFVLVSSTGLNLPFNTQGIAEPNNEDQDVRLRDLIVLVMRTFQNNRSSLKQPCLMMYELLMNPSSELNSEVVFISISRGHLQGNSDMEAVSPPILPHSLEDHRHLMVTHPDTYGRDGIREIITTQLLSNRDEDAVSNISIVARSGSGKTTLVRLIYHDQRVLDAFDIRLWIRMSDKFDERWLMTMIIEQATQVQCDVRELHHLVEYVKAELTEKKFLLVLENCVVENQSSWSNALEHLSVGAKGSSVIITTTRETVPRFSRTLHFYLSPLQDKDCLSIFQRYACDENHNPSRHHMLAKFSRIVPYKCGGNPLHVKAICGLLCHANNVLQLDDCFHEESSQGLELYFNVLPQNLKLCLEYCSLFPKEYVYDRHHIVQLWMSQGFIKCEVCGETQDIGTEYFNELVCRSFFNCSPLHGDKESKYVMHGLFHDLITSLSHNICFRYENHLSKMPEHALAARHLSIVPWERQTVFTLDTVTREVGHLDSFLTVNRSELQHSSMSSPFLKLMGLDDFFMKFDTLKTLNLSYTFIGQLPESIGNLKHLQYLAVNNTDINNLPSEICSLHNLRTLEARDCCYLISLPENLKNLVNLQHLDVRKQLGYVRMPFGLGQLVHLRTLPVLNVGGHSSDCSIWELRDLDNLHGDLALTGLENVKAGNNAKEAKLINKRYLKTLTLEWSDDGMYSEEDDGEIAYEVLGSLQPPSGLEDLTVRNYSGSLFSIWIEKFPFNSLHSITLDNCYNCCVLPALGELQSLRYLCLRKMYALKSFGYTPLPEKRCDGKFPALEVLKLWEIYELDGWPGVKDEDFPCLRNVSIRGCPMLKSLPCLPSLVDLSFHGCYQLPEIPRLLKLESLKVEGIQDMVSLDLPQGLPTLKNLEISHCNELVSVGLSALSSIEKLKIVKCPKLDIVNNWQQYHFKKIVTTRNSTVIST
ncbi:hypothetical protein ACP4OV_004498 [Aristida adscensionis]